MEKYVFSLNRLRNIDSGAIGSNENEVLIAGPGETPPERGVKGVYQHKLLFWFGHKTALFKAAVKNTKNGIRWAAKPIGFDEDNVTAIWSAGQNSCYVLVGSVRGPNYTENLRQLGFAVDTTNNEKWAKRLKRAFAVLTEGSSSDFTMAVTEPPEGLTDGFAMANLEFAVRITGNKRLRHGDILMYSYLGPEGQAKGSLWLEDGLTSDVVILGKHNIKKEIRTLDKRRLFCIEGFQEAKSPSTDIQTIVNLDTVPLFKETFIDNTEILKRLCEEGLFAQEWYYKTFIENEGAGDWFQQELKRRAESDDDKTPMMQTPHLTLAAQLGLNVNISPMLRKDAFYYEARRMPVDRVKAKIRREGRACRAYIMPDMACFNKNGEFNPKKAKLKKGEVAFPEGKLKKGRILMVRQPNAYLEYVTANNAKGIPSRSAVQLNVYDAARWLKRLGGGDYDDPLLGFHGSDIMNDAMKWIKKGKQHDVKKMDLEKFIDSNVASNRAPFTKRGQMRASCMEVYMQLGQIVNLNLVLVSTEGWRWYNIAADCKDDEELALLEQLYVTERESDKIKDNRRYPDFFMYKDRLVRTRYSRVPIKQFAGPRQRFEYHEAIPVTTRLGEFLEKARAYMDGLHTEVRISNKINTQCWISSKVGYDWLVKGIEEDLVSVRAGNNLHILWKFINGYGDEEKELKKYAEVLKLINLDWLLEQASKIPQNFAAAGQELGRLSRIIFEPLTELQRINATRYLATQLMERRRRREPNGSTLWCYGKDNPLWNSMRDDEYEILVDKKGQTLLGLQECWLVILQDFQDFVLSTKPSLPNTPYSE